LQFGAQIIVERATELRRVGETFHLTISSPVEPIITKFVLLAAGVLDHLPAIPGIEDAITSSVARLCPICDAYEAIDQRLAVLGDGDLALREASFLCTYSSAVTVLHSGDRQSAKDAQEANPTLEVLHIALEDLLLDSHGVLATVDGAPPRRFDYLYLALGCTMQSELAVRLGAARDEKNTLVVDDHQQTSVKGLYAAGDVVRGLNQIAVATAEAAIAATDIHNKLRSALAT
jgi:thioredoxin reductase (NADPH)